MNDQNENILLLKKMKTFSNFKISNEKKKPISF